MSGFENRPSALVRLACSVWLRLGFTASLPIALVLWGLAHPHIPHASPPSPETASARQSVELIPTATGGDASTIRPAEPRSSDLDARAVIPRDAVVESAHRPERPAWGVNPAITPRVDARSIARSTVAVNTPPALTPLVVRPNPAHVAGLPQAYLIDRVPYVVPAPTLLHPPSVSRHGLKIHSPFDLDERVRPFSHHGAGSAAPMIWAANASGSPTVDIGKLLGANRFYDAGYTGLHARVANVEGGTPWRGHETMNWMPAGNIFWSGTGLNELTNPTSTTAHATSTSMNMVGKPPAGSADPVHERGIAYGIDPNNFYAGNIASTISGLSFVWSSYSDYRNVYYRAIVEGVGLNNTVNAANRVDVVSSSWGGDAVEGAQTGAYNLHRATRIVDAIAFEGNQTRGSTIVIAAGNNGGANTIGSPATGFNSLVVGALGESSTDAAGTAVYNVAAGFSSRGPISYRQPASPTDLVGTDVGAVRARVDLAAPGFNMTLATTGNANSYSTVSGTSFATPTVAGGVALLADYSWSALAPADARFAVDGRVMKAVLINSADKTSGWTNGQGWDGSRWATSQGLDYATGGGRMNLDQAFSQYANPSGNTITQLVNPSGAGPHSVLSTGWARATIDRPNSTVAAAVDFLISGTLTRNTELNTTLSWFVRTGSAAFTTNPDQLGFHNLNLEVWRTDGSGTAQTLVGVSTADHNTVEHLSFLVPQDGQYLIRVVRPADANGGTYYSFPGDSTSDVFGLAWMTRSGLLVPSGTTAITGGTAQSQANVLIAPDVGQTATLAVSGAGTRINTLNRLFVGGTDRGAGGTGTLSVAGGAVVDVSNALQVYPGGTVSVADATLSGGVLALNAGSGFAASGNSIVQFSRIDAAAPIVVPAGGNVTIRSYHDSAGSNSGRLNLLTSSASFNIDGRLLVQPIIAGSNGLVKNGSGTLIIAPAGGQNSYSGATVVNAGTLELGVGNALPDGSVVRLNGGTFSTGASTGFSDTVGALELADSSRLVLGAGGHALTFSGLTGTPTGILTITGWTGTPKASGTAGDILFSNLGGTPNSTFASFLTQVEFQGYAPGDATFILSSGTTYELVPVPEPGAVLGIAVSALVIGAGLHRVRRKSAEPT